VVERGTRADERVRRCRLDELAVLDVEPPATIVIGAVAALDLRSRQRAPLPATHR
jgi:siroheme synthase